MTPCYCVSTLLGPLNPSWLISGLSIGIQEDLRGQVVYKRRLVLWRMSKKSFSEEKARFWEGRFSPTTSSPTTLGQKCRGLFRRSRTWSSGEWEAKKWSSFVANYDEWISNERILTLNYLDNQVTSNDKYICWQQSSIISIIASLTNFAFESLTSASRHFACAGIICRCWHNNAWCLAFVDCDTLTDNRYSKRSVNPWYTDEHCMR